MRWMLKLLDVFRPWFNKGGKFEAMHPLFEAGDNFLFSSVATCRNAPYARDPMDVKRYMSMVIVALMPAFLASIYFFGWRVLAMILVSYVAGGIVEVAFAIVRKEEINEGFLVTGFIFPLCLPPGLPLWLVAVGIVFGVLIGKEVFGGTGRNLFNPAIVGRCFLALGYPSVMSSTWIEPGQGFFGRLLTPFPLLPDAVTSATPLVLAKGGDLTSPFDLFIGNVAGSAGETSAFAILLGGIFLVVVGVANWRTVVSILGSFSIGTFVLHVLYPHAVNPLWFNFLAGSILFGAFFMATDPVTSPVTQAGKWAYGILIGTTAVLIRNFSGYVEGVMFSILFGNICAPLIDEAVIRLKMRKVALER